MVDNIISTVDFKSTILGLMGFEPSDNEQGHDASELMSGAKVSWKDKAFMHLKPGSAHLGIWTPQYSIVS